MKLYQRKEQRISEFMPVMVSIIRNANQEALTEPIEGRIVNFCRGGACLLMNRVQAGTRHVFYSPISDSSLSLQLHFSEHNKKQNLNISARPVWLNTLAGVEFQKRLMGVAFLNKNNKIVYSHRGHEQKPELFQTL